MTISRLARQFALSRSTLLYYDHIGLLRPSHRTAAGYRRYTQADVDRLSQICLYRQTGLALEEIAALLDAPSSAATRTLERQLRDISAQIDALRRRQRLIASLLGNPHLAEELSPMNRKRFSSLLRAAGLDEAALAQWHADFEHAAGDEHQRFLEFLNIADADIASIRERARNATPRKRR